MAVPDVTPLEAVDKGLANLRADRERLDRIHRYLKGEHDGPARSTGSRPGGRCPTGCRCWAPAHALAMEGYRRSDADGDTSGASVEWEA
jgi:hypothetical protein